MVNVRTVLKNVTSMTAMRLLSAALSFLFVVSVARTWGAVSLGQFSLLLSFFIFMQQMPLMGLHLVVIRDTAAHPETVPVQVANTALIAMAIALLLALVFGLAGSHVYRASADMSNGTWLVALSIVPTGFVCVIESMLIGQQRMLLVAGWNIAENLIRTVASFAVLWLGMGITAVFVVFFLGRLLIAFGYYRGVGFTALVKGITPSWHVMKNYLHQIPTFFGIMICSAAINRLDFILLSALGSLRDVGLYSAPYKVYEVALMAPSLITTVLLPVFSGYFQTSRDRFGELFEATARILLIVAIPCIGLSIFYSSEIMQMFGHDYAGMAWLLQLMLITVAFVAMNQLFSLAMLVSHNQKLDFRVLAWSCLLYGILLTATIPHWGLVGAALSTFVVALLQPLLRYAMLHRLMHLTGLGPMLGTVLLAAAAMALAYVAAMNTLPGVAPAVACAAYVAAIWLLKGLTVDGLRGYRRFVGKA